MDNTEERFRVIYSRYMPLLRVIASRRSIPRDEIDRMVQECFLSFYTHCPVTWPEYKVRAELARIMCSLCAEYSGRQCAHPLTYMNPVTYDAPSRTQTKKP